MAKRVRVQSDDFNQWQAEQRVQKDHQLRKDMQALLNFAAMDLTPKNSTGIARSLVDLMEHFRSDLRSGVVWSGFFDLGDADAPVHPAPSLRTLRRWQEDLRAGFARLFPVEKAREATRWSTDHWIIPVAVERLCVYADMGRVGQLMLAHRWPGLFWLAVAALLGHLGTDLRRCELCGGLFLRVRRQVRCERTECARASGRERSKAWYERNREVAKERRRASYERAQQKATSSKVKIGRPAR